ncbi:hypothetical protein GCM10011369_33750 [Neiella marina]|uniref:GGDEF domain-containing protein n=1 Tax=Neiella marina TaxID=508461 RepID=A0A8J2XPQ5_9GAMM|nr:GGDEF domain-containing protein [Neiella marina]GGA88863.1 hypothetical protein GCM10011369_33750 [Neiella marina]
MRSFFRNAFQANQPECCDLFGSLKKSLINDVWIALIILAPFGTFAGVCRALQTGVTYTLVIQSLLIVAIVGFFFVRNNFTVPTQAIVAIACLFAIGTPALFQFGFYSASFLWFFFATLIVAYCFPKHLVYSVLATSAMVLFAGYLFVSGRQTLPVDANVLIHQLEGWGAAIFAILLFGMLMIKAISAYNARFHALNIKLAEQKQQIEKLANHDQLTGLPNKRLAIDRLKTAIELAKREQHKVALLYIDLDDFKPVNDRLGHDAGDWVLKTVAQRLSTTIRKSDSVCRVGGDEFIAILPAIKSAAVMQQVCEKLIAAVAEDIEFNGHRIHIGVSIGVSIYPTMSDCEATLQQIADQAMYHAKQRGKNQFAFAQDVAFA